ncbi:hypothetical protein H4R34_006110 [Dimargaris verticillata]|uniref:J domain-containing protein n=1 Tax=Dimargaris verticillata TaxID=2761393 RepID=A0A9W8AWD0_9FUNG|nr:hypothetical protein H4R34_006110 [Dimargaris verticillata]
MVSTTGGEFPDYYEVLGVSASASSEDIRKAYMREALRSHPDRNDDPHANQTFQQVADAYFTLSDQQRRTAYDNARQHRAKRDRWNRQYNASAHADASSMFGSVFEDLLRPEVENPRWFWTPIGYLSGGFLGFIIANLPGAVAGAFAGGKLGGIRDSKGKSVYEVFSGLQRSQKYAILQALLMQVLAGNYK